MPLIDDRGRLFGRVNVIDAGLVAFFLVLMPIVYTASRLFREPKPAIESVEPAAQPAGPERRIRVHGRNLRPFMRALVSPTGEPFALLDPSPLANVGNILLETSSVFEVKLPPLGPGSYDVHLFDTTQEVATLTHAFSLTAPPVAEKAKIPEGIVEAKVRSTVYADVAKVMRAGDVDVSIERPAAPAAADAPAATLKSIHIREKASAPVFELRAPNGSAWTGGWRGDVDARTIDLEFGVAIPVRQNSRGIWEYAGQTIRIGDAFRFQTTDYSVQGVIEDVSVPARKPASTQ